MNLIHQIHQGESKTLELKRQLPRHEQIAQTAVAFANTSGGKLIIGVDDHRKIAGVAETDIFTLQDQITSIILDRCYPSLLPEIYTSNINGKLVLVVEIFRGNLMPYYLKAEGKNNGTYLRIGACNRKAELLQLVELERQRINQSFDRKEYAGDLFSQLEQAEAFIKNHINLRGEIKGLQRTDTYELPEAALREALTNALIHRDYTNQGRDIKVGIYDDIVNIVSPGGFPSTLTADGLREGRSEIRNRVIARVFKELGYIEQWGTGLQRIKKTCLDHGLQEPRIREISDSIDIEFQRPRVSGISEVPDTAGYRRIPPNTNQQESVILKQLDQNGMITAAQVMHLLSVKERRAREILKQLSEKHLLEKRGSARSTYYTKINH